MDIQKSSTGQQTGRYCLHCRSNPIYVGWYNSLYFFFILTSSCVSSFINMDVTYYEKTHGSEYWANWQLNDRKTSSQVSVLSTSSLYTSDKPVKISFPSYCHHSLNVFLYLVPTKIVRLHATHMVSTTLDYSFRSNITLITLTYNCFHFCYHGYPIVFQYKYSKLHNTD